MTAMGKLKDMLLALDGDEVREDEIEVLADSVRQALELASRELNTDISSLDYDILEKGTAGLFGIGRQPYRVLVRPIKTSLEEHDFEKIEHKLTGITEADVSIVQEKHADGSFTVRVLKTGVWITIKPPKGRGRPVDSQEITNRLFSMQINNADLKKIEKEARKPSGKPIKAGEWVPRPEWDSSFSVEITDDEMKCFINFIPPKFSGRHMDIDDVLNALRANGVVAGIREDTINAYLEAMNYSSPLLARGNAAPSRPRRVP